MKADNSGRQPIDYRRSLVQNVTVSDPGVVQRALNVWRDGVESIDVPLGASKDALTDLDVLLGSVLGWNVEAAKASGVTPDDLRAIDSARADLAMAGRVVTGKLGLVSTLARALEVESMLAEQTQLCLDVGVELKLDDDVVERLVTLSHETDGSADAIHDLLVEHVETPLVDALTTQALLPGDTASFGLDSADVPRMMTERGFADDDAAPGEVILTPLTESAARAERVRRNRLRGA